MAVESATPHKTMVLSEITPYDISLEIHHLLEDFENKNIQNNQP